MYVNSVKSSAVKNILFFMNSKMLLFQFIFSLIYVCSVSVAGTDILSVEAPALTQYEPTWDSLDSRPLPTWFDDAKVGIFIHWGVFSVPSFSSEWFWSQWKSNNPSVVQFMNENYPPNFTYQEFAKEFKAEFYDPNKWADLFQAAGAKYVVLTSKHHEGYTLWPSKYSFSWNAKDVGPNRDLLGDLALAIRNRTDLKFGLYHSLYEWYNPLYVQDKNNGFNTSYFVQAKTLPELRELINVYKPEVIWSDGDWEAYDNYWTSREFLAWLYNESPVKDTVVVNDRWGIDIPCRHGDFYSCQDRYSPGVLQPHKWENAMTIDKQSWGYRREATLSDYMTIEELLEELVKTVSTGGNILMNVGPTSSGIIAPIYEERLRQIGSWLNINGEAIYSSRPWTYQNDTLTSNVWYTKNGNYVYANVLFWPENGLLKLGAPELNTNATVCLLSFSDCNLDWEYSNDVLQIQFPEKALVKSNWAYVLKFSDVTN